MIDGLAPREVAPPGRERPIMITPVKRGTIQLGKTLSEIHNVKRDDMVKVKNGEFEVDRVLAEKGSGAPRSAWRPAGPRRPATRPWKH